MPAEYVVEHHIRPWHMGALSSLMAAWWVRAYGQIVDDEERDYYAARLDAAREVLSAIGLAVGRDERGAVIVKLEDTGAERPATVR